MKKILFIIGGLVLVSSLSNAQNTNNMSLGKQVQSIQLKDANDVIKNIPYLGEYTTTIFYTDPDAKDVNDELSNAIKARKYPETKYKGIGVGNCADTWIPDAAIRMGARDKEKQFPGAVILLDEDRLLAKQWGLGDCNDAGVVIIIGKDKKIKFMRAVKSSIESKGIISTVLHILDAEIGK